MTDGPRPNGLFVPFVLAQKLHEFLLEQKARDTFELIVALRGCREMQEPE